MGYIFSTKEHSLVDDVRKYGLRVAMWNLTFVFTSWLFRVQGGTGMSVRGGANVKGKV